MKKYIIYGILGVLYFTVLWFQIFNILLVVGLNGFPKEITLEVWHRQQIIGTVIIDTIILSIILLIINYKKKFVKKIFKILTVVVIMFIIISFYGYIMRIGI
ncbi:hypothetical protein EOM39_04015 [Candidatus Gracilibacteria bacterium]|nr:hypothetical protein [Candidatus Gracilibacteria bacterium]